MKIISGQLKKLILCILLTVTCVLSAYENFDHNLLSAFIVNDDTSGDAEQTNPKFGMDNSGQITLVWLDSRDGDLNIYMRQFNHELSPIGTDQRVNDDPGLADQIHPIIAVQSSGKGLVVWEDWRDESPNIYMQLYSREGQKIGINQRVNDDVIDLQSEHVDPAVIATDSTFIIAWSDNRTGRHQIMIQTYNFQAQPVAGNVLLTDGIQGYDSHRYPDLALWSGDSLLIAWQAVTGNVADMYIGKINIKQPGLVASLLIPDGSNPQIASRFMEKVALVWVSNTEAGTKMNARIFNGDFQLISSIIEKEILVSESRPDMIRLFPSPNAFCLLWEEQEEKDISLYFQSFQPDGWVENSARLPVSDRPGSQYEPFGMTWNQNVYYCWQDHAHYNGDTGLSVFPTDQPLINSVIWLNTSQPASDQKIPKISINANGQCMIVWEDLREGYQDIYGQLYNASLEPIGQNIRINSNYGSRHQHYPDVSINESGESVVVWRREKSDSTDIVAQRFDPQGEKTGDPIVLNDFQSTRSQNIPRVAMGDDGAFLVVWREWINNNFDMVYQFIDKNNVKVGQNAILNDDANNATQWQPSVATDGLGLYIAAWEDDRKGSVDIFGQLLRIRQRIENNIPIYSDSLQFQGTPSVDMNRQGEFVVAWRDNRQYLAKVFYQRFHPNFSYNGPEINVDADAQTIQKNPSIAISNNGDISISWTDFTAGDALPVLKMQRFDASNSPSESAWILDDGYTYYHDVGMNDQKCILVWQDNTRQTGWDILAKESSYGIDAVDNNLIKTVPEPIQAFPNPFNHQTQIKINLPANSFADLWLYNTRGQMVRHWRQSEIRGTDLWITWDGCDQYGHMLTSGVYILELHAVNKIFNYKMVLIR